MIFLAECRENHKSTYNEIKEQIESLLPGATAAGLSSAYNELKKEFQKPIKLSTGMFYASLIMILVFGLATTTQKLSLVPFVYEQIALSNTDTMLRNLIHNIPIMLPVIWLAIFSSKRRSEYQRLHQEYAHKEAIAKSYESFRKQISQLENDKHELTQELLSTAIEALKFNASTTLDKKHGDKLPLQEIVETVARKLPLNKG